MLTAGPELDALVAEKVMGWEPRRSKHGHWEFRTPEGRQICTYGRRNYSAKFDAVTGQRLPEVQWREDLYHGDELPAYSSDVSTAWQIIQRMRELGWGFILNDARGQYRMRFWRLDNSDGWDIDEWVARPDMELTVWEDSVSMAICLAALKSVGVEVPE